MQSAPVALQQSVQQNDSPLVLGRACRAGLDLHSFSEMVNRGLNVKAFVTAFNGGALNVAYFDDTLSSMPVSEVNDCLEMVAETVEEHEEEPDVMERALNRIEA